MYCYIFPLKMYGYIVESRVVGEPIAESRVVGEPIVAGKNVLLHFSPQNVRVHFGPYQANPAGIAVFQLLVVAKFGASAIFQLLV